MDSNWQRYSFPFQQKNHGFRPRYFPNQNNMSSTPNLNFSQPLMNVCPQISSFNSHFSNIIPQGVVQNDLIAVRSNVPQFELKPQQIVDNFLTSIKHKRYGTIIETKATSMGNSLLQVSFVYIMVFSPTILIFLMVNVNNVGIIFRVKFNILIAD